MNANCVFSRIFSGLVIAGAFALSAHADVSDRPAFQINGLVIVWSADTTGNAPIASDFIINDSNGRGDSDLIAGDAHTVVTGSLVSTADQPNAAGGIPFVLTNTSNGTFSTDTDGNGLVDGADGFSAFGLNPGSDAQVEAVKTYTSFYVASNTAFAIDADVDFTGFGLPLTLLNVTGVEMSVTQNGDDGLAFGSAAQLPHTGGPAAGMTGYNRLRDLLAGGNIFTGNQRTAATPGTIAEQSVRFDLVYSIGTNALRGYDLSLGTFDFEVDVTYTVFIP